MVSLPGLVVAKNVKKNDQGHASTVSLGDLVKKDILKDTSEIAKVGNKNSVALGASQTVESTSNKRP